MRVGSLLTPKSFISNHDTVNITDLQCNGSIFLKCEINDKNFGFHVKIKTDMKIFELRREICDELIKFLTEEESMNASISTDIPNLTE